MRMIEEGIAEQDKVSAIAGVMGLSQVRLSASKQAEFLADVATKQNHSLAQRLVEIHLHARTALSADNNFLCQAAWMMAGGYSPIAGQSRPVDTAEVSALLKQARERWKEPKPIPRWCCDGLHSAGDDPRFMGTWFHMYAACRAFERYGRLDPRDTWMPEFYCYDGLTIASDAPPCTGSSKVPRLARRQQKMLLLLRCLD
jgi:hypothetical protein